MTVRDERGTLAVTVVRARDELGACAHVLGSLALKNVETAGEIRAVAEEQ